MAPERQWIIDEEHPNYGTVVMMGITGGEQYRWFDDGEGNISMIPLFILQEKTNGNKED